ncbi:hypothetical protein BJ912DRAFT_955294 [Pholiota molesta]|nr:hypothetical protein BJ912DRAFT_955294 [Pholiota molesta]
MNRGKRKHSLSEAESPRSQQRQLRPKMQMDAGEANARQDGGYVMTDPHTEGRAEAAAGASMSRHTQQPLAPGDGGGHMALPQRQPLATTNDDGAHILWPHAYGTTSNVAATLTSISPGAYHSPTQWSSAFDMRPEGMDYGSPFVHPNIGELALPSQEATEAYANAAQMLGTAAAQTNGGFSITVSGYITSPLSLSFSSISPFSTLENALSPVLSSPTSLSASSPTTTSSAPSPSASLPFALTSASTECLAGHSASSSSPELDSGTQIRATHQQCPPVHLLCRSRDLHRHRHLLPHSIPRIPPPRRHQAGQWRKTRTTPTPPCWGGWRRTRAPQPSLR